VRVIEGVARFSDKDTVSVGDEIAIKARRFVVAAGSSPSRPPIPGLKDTPYLTNETIFDLTVCPQHLIVIGAGPIGLELAQAFRRLGAAVTVLEAAQPLAREDAECARIVLDQLAEEGVVLRQGVTVTRVEATVGHAQCARTRAGYDASRQPSAGGDGRRANVDGLAPRCGAHQAHARGIVVNRGLRTSNRRVYAIGDVAGGPQFTHAANYHAGLVIRNALFRLPVKATTA
jgi:pyruvate/2-oxoglutarate dehydrogenase complex dihydrolipoamide dehydrogenase (E3) component